LTSGKPLQIIAGPFKGMHAIFEKLVKSPCGEERAFILFELLGKIQQIRVGLTDFR
jgi:hypothetical protein